MIIQEKTIGKVVRSVILPSRTEKKRSRRTRHRDALRKTGLSGHLKEPAPKIVMLPPGFSNADVNLETIHTTIRQDFFNIMCFTD